MRISRAGACHAERGFTLVELGMVIFVLGMVMATVMPRFSGTFERQQLRSTINVVHGTVRYVHAHAALTKRIYRLVFDLDRQIMSVCYLSGETCILETTRELRDYAFPAHVHILDVVLPQGGKIREGLAATHFHPTGLAEPSVIHLITDSNQKITLMIEPLAGRVKVYDEYVEATAG
ncbi:MAG: Tfp pilus assembly protein FimT/FimU [Candidatus Tectimicrobiota bacterium]